WQYLRAQQCPNCVDCIEAARPLSYILVGEQQLSNRSPARIERLSPLPHQFYLAGCCSSLAFHNACSAPAQTRSACRNCPGSDQNHLEPTTEHRFNLISEMFDKNAIKAILIGKDRTADFNYNSPDLRQQRSLIVELRHRTRQ